MPLKILAGITAMALFIAYYAPIVFKLKEFALAVVVLGGIVLVAVDVWESLRD